MGGAVTRIFALLLIAFVAFAAQCVASCSMESLAQPPCHKTSDQSCSHDQAVDDILKVVTVELHAAAIVPAAVELRPDEPSLRLARRPAPPPPLRETISTTVLRI